MVSDIEAMNIMRKLLTQRDSDSITAANSSTGRGDSDQTLSLMHLNKLFNELKNSSGQFISGTAGPSKYMDTQAHQAVTEYEQKIYRLLPLFLKVSWSVKRSKLF